MLDSPPVATLEEVSAVEKEIGFKIPADYVEVARHNQGRMTMRNGHSADGRGSALGGLYHFHGALDDGRLGWGSDINEELSTLLLPFSEDPGGNFFAFDYDKNPQNSSPTIVFWDHETGIVTTLANSFTDFLGQLIE